MYSVKHKQKSVALIFNHKHFDKITSRDGSEKDEEVLREVLKGFDARFYTDCTVSEIEENLAGVAKEDHNDRDCLLVIVMTHGDRKNELYAKDGPYHSSKLWSTFTPNKVSSLAGKPKIFLIQSCRGRNTDGGWQTDSYEKDYYFPTHPDFLIVHATMEGHISWRNTKLGSILIQYFCIELKRNIYKRDFMALLTLVLRRVALSRQTADHQQMPVITSTLTKLLYI